MNCGYFCCKIIKFIPDDSHLGVRVSEEQDNAQETMKTQLQNEITFCQSYHETPQANYEVVKAPEEPDAKQEIIVMESDSQEAVQKTPGMQTTLDHCCEAESAVPSAKKIKTVLHSQYSKTWVKL